MSPAVVSTASPRPIGAFSSDSRWTAAPPARLIAPATPPPCISRVLAVVSPHVGHQHDAEIAPVEAPRRGELDDARAELLAGAPRGVKSARHVLRHVSVGRAICERDRHA